MAPAAWRRACIDCHKGIAHRGVDPGWLPPEEVREDMGLQSSLQRNREDLVRYVRDTAARQ